jgi:perosamine synthetase
VSITDAEMRAVSAELLAGTVSGTGAAVARLEADLSRRLGRCYAVATNSGTSALELAFEVLDIGLGDEVLIPGFTFAAPASAVVNRRATPVLCDVDPATWTLDPAQCRSAITERTKAVVAVDVLGNPCDFTALAELGVPVVEDAAQAIGARYRDTPCGGWGVVSVLSFHANKTVAAGEGGMLLCDDRALAERARITRDHGMGPGYEHRIAGRNLRMPNLVAAFAAAQAARTDELVRRRRDVEARYREGLANCPVTVQTEVPGSEPSTWLSCFRTKRRNELVEYLRCSGIDARAVWPSLDAQPFLNAWARPLPVSRRLAAECFWLPTYHDIERSQVQAVVSAVRTFFGGDARG